MTSLCVMAPQVLLTLPFTSSIICFFFHDFYPLARIISRNNSEMRGDIFLNKKVFIYKASRMGKSIFSNRNKKISERKIILQK